MNDRIIEFDPLIEGFLIKRYKRFLADIQLDTGEIVTAHCANTGPMKGLLNHGSKVRLSLSSSPKRKLPYTWDAILNALERVRENETVAAIRKWLKDSTSGGQSSAGSTALGKIHTVVYSVIT